MSDHFSRVASSYAEARPLYPAELFTWIAGLCPEHACVWDVGCGNGQASVALAEYFQKVAATDVSAAQIAAAQPHPRVTYRVFNADDSGLEAGTVDLITIAQALHWFDLDAFYTEVRRVARPEGVIAAWTYGMFHLPDAALMERLLHFYDQVVGPYWPPERIHPETGYAQIAFPFERLPAPACSMHVNWTLAQMLGMLRSWSATGRYQKALGIDPVAAFEPELQALWGDAETVHHVSWPVTVLAAKVNG